ncbi:hypothetical protein PF003_g4602 [Phytophthora fragariae]|nr:hypothetical protein PF003_g4602 [Phytophthora fragariae]
MQSTQRNVVEWILDSGSQANICGDLALFTTIREDTTSRLDFANGTTEHACIRGSVLLRIVNQATGVVEDRLLDDVVYTPNAKVNIISLGYLQMTGRYRLSCSPDQKIAWLSKPDTVLKFEMHENIYRLHAERVPGVMVMAALKEDMDSKKQMEFLHQRIGHVAMDTMKRLAHKFDVGVKLNAKGLTSYECVACAEAKAKRMTHARIEKRDSKPLQVLMMDVCSIKPATIGGCSMFLLVVDEATRFKWAFLMQHKSEATFHLKILMNRLRTQLREYKVELLWSDRGGEFLSTELETYCNEHGVELKTTNSYSPQENGIVERANGVVLPRIRAMVMATHLPNILWGEALLHVVETLNNLPTQPLELTSPRRRLFREEPQLDDMRVWGCIAHVRIPPESRQRKDKMEPRARLALLLGYSLTTPGYKFMDLKTAQVITAQGGNVRFHEEFTADGTYVRKLLENAYSDGDHQLPDTVPVARVKTGMDSYLPTQNDVSVVNLEQLIEEVPFAGASTAIAPSSSGSPAKSSSPSVSGSAEHQPGIAVPVAVPAETPPPVSKAAKKRRKRRARKQAEAEKETSGFDIQPPPMEPCLKRPRRTQRPSVRLKDYVVGNVMTITDILIPTTYKQARASKHWHQWRAAMLAELESLKGHKTWKLQPRSMAKNLKVITCRWVFAVKRDERGHIKRFKARLVIHGFKQQLGINYSETYAPVIRFETIRAAIYFAVQRDWEVLQYDVKTAFLYGELEELIFMEQPPGFQVDGPGFICRLLKSLYGLKQAPNIWNKTLHAKLLTMGFERTESDYGLYMLKEENEVCLLLTVYVDDLLLMGPRDLCAKVAASLQETFELTTMGNVKYLLGVEILINRPRREVVYCQRQYVHELLKRFHMENCNGCATPEAVSESTAVVPATSDYMPYRELVGALQYLVGASRPDIAHATRHLGKYLACYDHTHYAQAKRVLRYLKATSEFGLLMNVTTGDEVRVAAYSDADYANDPVDRRSVSGYVTTLDGNVVSYASRKQEINALSTCEAEYIAMSEATKDLLWLSGLCKELEWKHSVPLLLGDNQGAIALTAKPGKHSKSKHIDNKRHMVRRNVELKLLTTQHVGTEDMVADIMTKALGAVKFARFRRAMQVLPVLSEDSGATTSTTASEAAASSTMDEAAASRD